MNPPFFGPEPVCKTNIELVRVISHLRNGGSVMYFDTEAPSMEWVLEEQTSAQNRQNERVQPPSELN
jgi:hypothetical protein